MLQLKQVPLNAPILGLSPVSKPHLGSQWKGSLAVRNGTNRKLESARRRTLLFAIPVGIANNSGRGVQNFDHDNDNGKLQYRFFSSWIFFARVILIFTGLILLSVIPWVIKSFLGAHKKVKDAESGQ